VTVTAEKLTDAPVLTLTSTEVLLDQHRVGTVAALLADPAPLHHELQALRALWEEHHPNKKFVGQISFQADRNLPSTTVGQVLALLPKATWPKVQLAVVVK
jgi:biopolymer transport protein ExbD